MIKESTLSLPNGKKIFLRIAEIKTEKAILIVHGGCEHSGRYLDIINFLLDNGYSVFVPDLPGHGKSEGKRTHIDSFKEYLVCVNKVFELIQKNYPRIHLMGNSMGGLIATRYTEDYQPKIASLILNSPLFAWAETPVNKINAFIVDFLVKLSPELTFKNPVKPALLSRDKSVGEEYVKDPLVFNSGTMKMGAELAKNFKIALKGAKKIKVPLLLLAGGGDKIVSLAASKRFFEEATNSKAKRMEVFEGFFHEIYNETEKEKPFNSLKKWLKEIDS